MSVATQYDIGEGSIVHEKPFTYVKQLAKYMKDPSAIQAACRNEYGRDCKVPTVAQIRAMMPKPLVRRKDLDVADNDDGSAWAPRSLLPKRKAPERYRAKPRRFPWPNWYIPPGGIAVGENLVDSVSAALGLCTDDVCSLARNRELVVARCICAKIFRERGDSLRMISERLGGRDHTSVAYWLRVFPDWVRPNSEAFTIYKMHGGGENG